MCKCLKTSVWTASIFRTKHFEQLEKGTYSQIANLWPTGCSSCSSFSSTYRATPSPSLAYWLQFIYILGSIQIGLNMGGFVSLFIYIIVSGCCLSPEAWSQLDHLRLRASKASQQFSQCIFWVQVR